MARPIIRSLAVAAAAALALVGCTSTSNTDYTLAEGKLTICADIPYPPFEFEDPSSPTGYSGFDMEIASAIAERLELELTVLDVDFDALQSGTVLVAGNCDMGTSAITITEARKANIDFADPYYDSLQSLLVPKASNVTSLSQLENQRIGVQQGTTGLNYAQGHAPASATLVEFPSDGELWPALQAGQIAAILQDQPVNHEHEVADSDYVIVEEYDTDEQYGFAFAKGERTKLREDVNTQLAAIRSDGTYDDIYAKYFG
ncbi:MAG: transporter substrate-binding domain-containing protein [Propionibacteriaceae bacterium]|jgi:polar amino acid transport system substrate-binding protein|nr:transporter substrate-binding domain-containing protein [Propionibacteriaceae bacterium]